MIKRILSDQIVKDLNRGKVQVIFGARQIGKTTLIDSINDSETKTLMLNCDDADDRDLLTDKTTTELRNMLLGYARVCIDEAQRVPNIGMTLKK
jgi:Predicted ATPase (AAA+ superfamily)